MSIESRIRDVRKHFNLTQSEFADQLGVTRNVISMYELSHVAPPPIFLDHLCMKYGVDQTWLETGEGEMFHAPSVDEELAAFVSEVIFDDNDFKRRVFYAMSRMDDAAWDAFERFWNDMRDADIGRKKEKDGQ